MRSLFPALGRYVWLDTPTAPPGCRPVTQAVRDALKKWEDGDLSWRTLEATADATRELFASLIGGRASDVSLQTSLSQAAATVAAGLEPGRIVAGSGEFRSNLFPWLALRERGFEVAEVEAVDGVVSTQALCDAITPGTVLVALSEVQSSNGFRADTARVAAACRAVGARLFVNVTQSLGALDFDVEATGSDYVGCHGYKWLLAPRGAAWLWARDASSLRPLAPSWRCAAEPYTDFYGGPMELAPDARRADASLPWFSWAGAKAALDVVSGWRGVQERVTGLAARLRERASQMGYQVVFPELASQTVGVTVPDPDALRRRLESRKVKAAVRAGFLRLGFHAYNDEDDLEAALDVLS